MPATERPCRFVEVEAPRPKEEEALPDRIDCCVLPNVDPRSCGPLARALNAVLPLRRATNESDGEVGSAEPGRGGRGAGLPRTDHLKRIRRRPASADEVESRLSKSGGGSNGGNGTDGSELASKGDDAGGGNPKKRSKKDKKNGAKKQDAAPYSLDLLVGSVEAVELALEATTDPSGPDRDATPSLRSVLESHGVPSPGDPAPGNSLARRSLPGRPARDRDELEAWNRTLWPTLFFEERTARRKEEASALSPAEARAMERGMEEAIEDARAGRRQRGEWIASVGSAETSSEIPPSSGAAVVDPLSGSVMARASEERRRQGRPEAEGGGRDAPVRAWSTFPDLMNPLCTPVMLAIQGVSRREREIAMGCGMESEEFRSGQYLCTGYDVYLTKEPNVYEAMALVHSRVRRVVFGVRDAEMGGLGGAGDGFGVHSLPGTNHHYRAFLLDPGSSGCSDETAAALLRSMRDLHGSLV
ncbi:hypothetical protein ACHAWF_015541 [Thalassiosira exigua]